ncbi:MAG: glycosyltransferase, partial [Chloroflexia bacterium]|nr:glycosyltransferase [Chloroflexia bacterium]
LGEARFELASTSGEIQSLVNAAPGDSIHLCQGLRGNGLVGEAQRLIRHRGLRHFAIMETVDDAGWTGVIKRGVYRVLFWSWRSKLQGVLAIGRATPDWLVARGMPRSVVFPFAYFLREPEAGVSVDSAVAGYGSRPFRFIFVGRLIELKRVDSLIEALSALDRTDIELWVVGSGPLEAALRAKSAKLLPGRVSWLGVQPMSAVPALIAQADCLVLPSRHDGWGAVVSEALMVGTPAICSDACGASEAVLASQDGGVFPVGDTDALRDCLARQQARGLIAADRRRALAEWGRCLGARAGAVYLSQALQYVDGKAERPFPPWAVVSAETLNHSDSI